MNTTCDGNLGIAAAFTRQRFSRIFNNSIKTACFRQRFVQSQFGNNYDQNLGGDNSPLFQTELAYF